MTKAFGIEAFKKKWTEEFKKCKVARNRSRIADDFWNGDTACKELRRKHHLPEYSDEPIVISYERLFHEVEIYLRFANKIVRHNQDFNETLSFLSNAERWFVEKQKSLALPLIVDQLNGIARLLGEKRLALETHREDYWNEVLLASPNERESWYVDLETMVPIPPKDLVRTEQVFAKVRYPNDLTRRSDLDSHFQIRLGVILRHSMAGVSLRTIARLIILCYISADLVEIEEKSGELIINQVKDAPTRNRLTIEAVYQKLRSGGLR
jgi:hypothetical protein